MKNKFDFSAYLVVGRENTNGRPIEEIIEAAVKAGFTIIQIRSKVCSAKELIEDCKKAADVIAKLKKSDSVALVVDDRLDVVLACRDAGIKVDGIHVGQSDIPVSTCRKYLGSGSIVGLSAPAEELTDYVEKYPGTDIDYFGVGPLHETQTKADCGLDSSGNIITRTLEEISRLAKKSPVPVVVGGGVKCADIPALKKTGVHGFFVVSAVAGASEPEKAARELVEAWNA